MLPDLIEIVPVAKPVQANITVPGSKSITNRALILAALADGETVLEGALWSEDTQVMVECLQELGFMVNVDADPKEPCNRIITVYSHGGMVPAGGTIAQPMELFVGNAGTAARFLTAFLCLGKGVYRLHGVPRMHERPQAALLHALRELGYRIDSPNDRLPVVIHGAGAIAGRCSVSIEQSSQFASALLLCAKRGGWEIQATGENAEESAYVRMTTKLIEAFPRQGGTFQIEPDASSSSYFWAANSLLTLFQPLKLLPTQTLPFPARTYQPEPGISLAIPASDWQIDAGFPRFLPLPKVVSRQTDLGDSIMTAMILAPFSTEPISFTDLGRLRVQECERVAAMRTELSRCGVEVVESGETLIISPSAERLHGAEVETYQDHRMAMCFAILGLKVPGIKIKNPSCVKKTFPNFFQKLATTAPQGLSASILDGRTGMALSTEDLFAE